MALQASTIWYTIPNIKIKLCKHQPSQFQKLSLWRVRHEIYPKCPRKVIMAQMGDSNKVSVQLGIVRERLWEVFPQSVKDFPWKKAGGMMLERLVFLRHKALKWLIAAFFIFSFISDALYSISRNQELVIPFGLLVGCLMTDFLRNILHELFGTGRSEGKGLQRNLLSIGCFFVLVKLISTYFSVQARVFLLHVANGGLMQLLWLWRSLVEDNEGSVVNSIANQDA